MVLRSSIHFAGWILAVFVAALSGCSQPRTAADRVAPPELRLEGVRFRLFRDDALRADGTASVLTYQRESTAVKAEEIRLRLHDARGVVELAAPSGTGTVSARTFEANGGLQAIRGTDTATTESASFDPARGSGGQVVGDRPVELAGTGYRLRGNGFTLDPAAGEIVLRGGTRLVAGLKGSGR
jgi:hypothetical protein